LKYILSIGSNIQPYIHVRQVLQKMHHNFDEVYVGRFFRSPADGMQSNHLFWNGAVLIDTPLSPINLKSRLCEWEEESGRDRSHAQCSLRDRTLDVDILWCEDTGWLELLSHVKACPYLFFPVSSLAYRREKQLMRSNGKSSAVLKPVFFSLNGCLVGRRVFRLK